MKVALVHDWLTGMRGGERCLLEFLKLYPNADIFTLVHCAGKTDTLIDDRVKAQSWIGKIWGAERFYRHFLPLFPQAVKSLDLRGYDLIISLSHAAAKNVKVPKNAIHLCYCFTPMRYIWDQAEHYFGKHEKILGPLLRYLRNWDKQGAKSVNGFCAISKFVSARIRTYYGRKSEIIFPPVRTDWITPLAKWKRGDAFLYAGALVPYKRPDLVVDAFNILGLQLVIAGTGPELSKLKDKAGSNIIFADKVSDAELSELFRSSRALIFPAVEDFGMIPVECMSAGRPVIGLDRGGTRESVNGVYLHQRAMVLNGQISLSDKTGIFIPSRAVDLIHELVEAVKFFIEVEDRFTIASCVAQAKKFSPKNFEDNWKIFSSKYLG